MPDRIYVKVTSDFDSTGYMKPRAIAWPDGRCFRIDDVRSLRPFDENRTLLYRRHPRKRAPSLL